MSLEEKLKKLDSEDSKKSKKFYFGCLAITAIISFSVVYFITSDALTNSANLTHCNCRDAFIWSQSGYNAAGFSGKLPERSDCAKKYADEAAEGVAQNEMTYYGADVIFQSYFNRMCND